MRVQQYNRNVQGQALSTTRIDATSLHLVSDGLVVDYELPLALVQDAQQLLVQDHLAQLQLHPSYRQLDQLRDVVELYAAEWLWDEP